MDNHQILETEKKSAVNSIKNYFTLSCGCLLVMRKARVASQLSCSSGDLATFPLKLV